MAQVKKLFLKFKDFSDLLFKYRDPWVRDNQDYLQDIENFSKAYPEWNKDSSISSAIKALNIGLSLDLVKMLHGESITQYALELIHNAKESFQEKEETNILIY